MSDSIPVYRSRDVKASQDFYGPLLADRRQWPSVAGHLEALAGRLQTGFQRREAYGEIARKNHLPAPSSIPETPEQLARLCIAREYGFPTWEAALSTKDPYNLEFEAALDAFLAGDLSDLAGLLQAHPDLVFQASPYGHRATLLHYAACNGVEIWRQQVPKNLPEAVQLLLEAGAKPMALAHVYGGAFTTLELLQTSAHPAAAGIAPALAALLS